MTKSLITCSCGSGVSSSLCSCSDSYRKHKKYSDSYSDSDTYSNSDSYSRDSSSRNSRYSRESSRDSSRKDSRDSFSYSPYSCSN